jgi:hypothetical protein
VENASPQSRRLLLYTKKQQASNCSNQNGSVSKKGALRKETQYSIEDLRRADDNIHEGNRDDRAGRK